MPFILKISELLECLVDGLLTVDEILNMFYYFKLLPEILLFFTLLYPVKITPPAAVSFKDILDPVLKFIRFRPEFLYISAFLCKIEALLIKLSLGLLVKELLYPVDIFNDFSRRPVLNYQCQCLNQFPA